MSKERWERFALRHKKGEKLSKHMKKTNFRANHLFFARDLLESLSNHSHCSFLKSDKSDSLTLLFCKEWRERFAQGCSFVKSDVSKSLKVTHWNEQFWAKQRRALCSNNHEQITHIALFKEWREGLAHFSLLYRVTWSICSRLLFCTEQCVKSLTDAH